MRHLVVFFVAVLCMGLAPAPSGHVYICNSPTAEVYHHTRACRGINNCTHTITPVTKDKAVAMGRRLCGWED